MDAEDKINLIMDWAEGRDDFDTEFVESLAEQWEAHGYLSGTQEQALDNIIEKWKIEGK